MEMPVFVLIASVSVCETDPFSGCPFIPREVEGDCSAGPGAACADADTASTPAAGTAGDGGHPCQQSAGQTPLHI